MKKKQRVIFCTYSSIYSSVILEVLLQSSNIEVVGIVNSKRLLKPSYNSFMGSLKFIQTTGWRYASYLFLITDIFSLLQPVSHLKSIHALAKKNTIPLLDTVDINNEEGIKFVQTLKPDVLLAGHFNQLFKAPILQLPQRTAINIHPSLLPDYKGVDPVFYALLRSEEQLGVTTHLMDEAFDTGLILGQQNFPADAFDNVFSHNMQLFRSGAEIAVNAIVGNQKTGTQQCAGNYDSWPDKNLVKSLLNKNNYLINLKEYYRFIID